LFLTLFALGFVRVPVAAPRVFRTGVEFNARSNSAANLASSSLSCLTCFTGLGILARGVGDDGRDFLGGVGVTTSDDEGTLRFGATGAGEGCKESDLRRS
jgi:hypothetical protein